MRALPNRLVNTDARVRPCALRTRSLCAGQLGISEPTKPTEPRGFQYQGA
jgi:hypothetical protein